MGINHNPHSPPHRHHSPTTMTLHWTQHPSNAVTRPPSPTALCPFPPYPIGPTPPHPPHETVDPSIRCHVHDTRLKKMFVSRRALRQGLPPLLGSGKLRFGQYNLSTFPLPSSTRTTLRKPPPPMRKRLAPALEKGSERKKAPGRETLSELGTGIENPLGPSPWPQDIVSPPEPSPLPKPLLTA